MSVLQRLSPIIPSEPVTGTVSTERREVFVLPNEELSQRLLQPSSFAIQGKPLFAWAPRVLDTTNVDMSCFAAPRIITPIPEAVRPRSVPSASPTPSISSSNGHSLQPSPQISPLPSPPEPRKLSSAAAVFVPAMKPLPPTANPTSKKGQYTVTNRTVAEIAGIWESKVLPLKNKWAEYCNVTKINKAAFKPTFNHPDHQAVWMLYQRFLRQTRAVDPNAKLTLPSDLDPRKIPAKLMKAVLNTPAWVKAITSYTF